jgi:hypothetical protein
VAVQKVLAENRQRRRENVPRKDPAFQETALVEQ